MKRKFGQLQFSVQCCDKKCGRASANFPFRPNSSHSFPVFSQFEKLQSGGDLCTISHQKLENCRVFHLESILYFTDRIFWTGVERNRKQETSSFRELLDFSSRYFFPITITITSVNQNYYQVFGYIIYIVFGKVKPANRKVEFSKKILKSVLAS